MTAQLSCSRPVFGIILFLSLTANVFFGGVMLGKHMFGVDGPTFQVGKLLGALQVLSPESRDKAAAAAQKDWPAIQKELKAVREKRDVVKNILVQKEYKDAELDKAMAAVKVEVDKLIDAGQALAKDVIKSVTPEERQKLIRMLPRPPAE